MDPPTSSMPQSHSPSASAEGSAYPWILEHILAYPGTYEIPLRTMYTLNCSSRAQILPQNLSQSSSAKSTPSVSPRGSPVSIKFPQDQELQLQQLQQQQQAALAATAQFKSSLMSQISNIASQPTSLPPSFITSFVRRCFPPELDMVDFPQALTGLDYLGDLKKRQERELDFAFKKLGIVKEAEADETMKKYPAVRAWITSMQEKQKNIVSLYTQLYVGLRRWTLINELAYTPFSKSNCLAMLNTLYPPSMLAPPTPQLTPAVQRKQRDTFFRYIQGVEKNGTQILDNLMQQGCRPGKGDENGWISVRDIVDKFLILAVEVINECSIITGVESLQPVQTEPKRNGRKVDSGISFVTEDRPSTGGSIRDKPLPPAPSPDVVKVTNKPLSTLEKIARELRRIRTKKHSQDDSSKRVDEKAEKQKAKTLKKMKSTSALKDLRDRNASFVTINGGKSRRGFPEFNIAEADRERAISAAKSSLEK
ncbi:MAG: hypothetical protein M1829_006756 [Trizodia sp. TS-e1964]|nr:MAG: hypothetical protein M1829_006756 [Trizodia sp. TS-e1964]